jgi:signal transduction histidine kinase
MKAILETQESERVRIAEDLHDAIGMRLGAIKIHLRMLKDPNAKSTFDDNLKDANILLEAAANELRILVRNLFPRIIEQHGLYAELAELKRQVNKLNILNVELKFADDFPKLLLDAEVNLYRVIQELCSNAIKYSSGSKITIEFESFENLICITFNDNGKGYEFDQNNSGLGLRNIKNRVALYEGKIKFTSIPNISNQLVITFDRKKMIKSIV